MSVSELRRRRRRLSRGCSLRLVSQVAAGATALHSSGMLPWQTLGPLVDWLPCPALHPPVENAKGAHHLPALLILVELAVHSVLLHGALAAHRGPPRRHLIIGAAWVLTGRQTQRWRGGGAVAAAGGGAVAAAGGRAGRPQPPQGLPLANSAAGGALSLQQMAPGTALRAEAPCAPGWPLRAQPLT